jgi:hypothetical protein
MQVIGNITLVLHLWCGVLVVFRDMIKAGMGDKKVDWKVMVI